MSSEVTIIWLDAKTPLAIHLHTFYLPCREATFHVQSPSSGTSRGSVQTHWRSTAFRDQNRLIFPKIYKVGSFHPQILFLFRYRALSLIPDVCPRSAPTGIRGICWNCWYDIKYLPRRVDTTHARMSGRWPSLLAGLGVGHDQFKGTNIEPH